MSSEETNAPETQRGTGSEKPPAETDEVAGHSRARFFTCPNCGAGNYYEPSWNAINCWRCGEANWPDK